MADEKVTSGIATEESFSLTMGNTTELGGDDGSSVGVDAEDLETQEDDVTTENEGGDDNPEGDDDTDSDEDAGDDDDSEVEDLGEFDPEDTEKWDAQYKTEDGSLNEDALSKEFWKNATDDNRGSLNEGTYAYLESLGVSRQMAKNVEAALVTQHDASVKATSDGDNALFTLAGEFAGDPEAGPDVLKTALDWGKGGGYSKKEQAKFNKVMEGKDPEAKKEAVELLLSRHTRANPKKAEPEKPRVPKRDVTKAQGQPGAGVQPFKNREEYRQARREAGDNQNARRLVAQRLAKSNF